MILGLGVSHQPINGALGIEMPSPAAALRRYVTDVQQWLRGEGPATHLPERPAAHPVPVHLAARPRRTSSWPGLRRLADGVHASSWYVPHRARAAQVQWTGPKGRTKAPGPGPCLDIVEDRS